MNDIILTKNLGEIHLKKDSYINVCSFELYKVDTFKNEDSLYNVYSFRYIEIKPYLKSSIDQLSYIHFSINTIMSNGIERYQSMVYSKGQTTSFPKSISRTGMSIFFTQVSILFGVDMHDVISCITDAHQEYFSPGPKPRTCLSNGAVYNALHGMISKRLLNTNMTNIKDAARKYEKKIKGERRMFKRFNIWVVFVNFLKPFHGDPHKISPSAFH